MDYPKRSIQVLCRFLVISVVAFFVFLVSFAQSPDHRVLYSSFENGEWQLFTMRTDGSDIQPFLPSMYEQLGIIVEASLSPDGNFLAAIVVVEYPGNIRRELRLLNVNTSEIQAFTPNSIDDHGHPVWSPDSMRLAFLGLGMNQDYGALYVYDLASQETVLITDSNIVDMDGSLLAFGSITAFDWSPDIQHFVVALQAIDLLGVERQTDSIFIVMNTDGTNAEIITPLDIEIGRPHWTQDPNIIIGVCHDDGADHDNICHVDLQSGHVNKLIAIDSSTTPINPNRSLFIGDLILLPNGQVIFELGSQNIYLYDPVTGTISAISNTGGSGQPVDEILGWVDLPTLPEPNEAPDSNAGPDQSVTDNDGDGSEIVILDGAGTPRLR